MESFISGMDPEEVQLDKEAVADVLHMFRHVPAIKIAREAFLSMTICSPFTFHIPKLGLNSNKDMELIIERHWMPWQRRVYDWVKLIGICPYYFEKPRGQTDHQVPIVPDIELGYITVFVNKRHKLEYKWYWSHGHQQGHAKNMLWIITDHSPTRHGNLKSQLASLLPQYRTILVLQRSLEIASTQCAKPSHILEYHPKEGTAKNDNLTQLVANFGERAAGLTKARQELARANEIRVRTDELREQTKRVAAQNAMGGLQNQKRLLYTDTRQESIERIDPGFTDRMLPLRPDFKYVAAQRPSIVADLDRHLQTFNTAAAANMDFAMELIQPTGSARSQNVKGSERFENERIKEAINFFTSITHAALIIAYKSQLENGFNSYKMWQVNRKGGDTYEIAELYLEMDVHVEMTCTPMTTYNDLRQMWLDGIISKDDFALHAFKIRALPEEQINVTPYPDKIPKDMISVFLGGRVGTEMTKKTDSKDDDSKTNYKKRLVEAPSFSSSSSTGGEDNNERPAKKLKNKTMGEPEKKERNEGGNGIEIE